MKAVVTCALTGVLTNPEKHPVPVTVEQMAASAKEAYDAGASVMHVHFRRQEPGLGHLPSWDPEVAVAICDASGAIIARGLSAYSAEDAAKLIGAKSADIESILGFRGRPALIHRDDLVLAEPPARGGS